MVQENKNKKQRSEYLKKQQKTLNFTEVERTERSLYINDFLSKEL